MNDSFKLVLPSPEAPRVVETGLMANVIQRTLALHSEGPIVVWSGPSRAGKTVTAQRMCTKLNEVRESHPNGFGAQYFEVGALPRTGNGAERRILKSVFSACRVPISDGVFRRQPLEQIAEQFIASIRPRRLQLLCVDEAGMLPIEAINGLVILRDVARNQGWPLSLVLIGMDDLPRTLRSREQVYNRVLEWCQFIPFCDEEVSALLLAMSPQLAERPNAEIQQMVAFLQERCRGLPGLIVPLLKRAAYWAQVGQRPLGLEAMRTAEAVTRQAEDAAVAMGGRRP
jgi:type II secretory pathway predicted ATPase ExeA